MTRQRNTQAIVIRITLSTRRNGWQTGEGGFYAESIQLLSMGKNTKRSGVINSKRIFSRQLLLVWKSGRISIQ